MFVCVCKAVTDTEVARTIQNGATTREQVTRACGAGGDCGACHEHIEAMIADAREATLVAASELVRKPVAA